MTTNSHAPSLADSTSSQAAAEKEVRTFIGKHNVRIGEYEVRPSRLIVAKNGDDAMRVLNETAATLYGSGDEPFEDGGYYSNGGEIHVSPFSLQEISLPTFLDLKKFLLISIDENMPIPV